MKKYFVFLRNVVNAATIGRIHLLIALLLIAIAPSAVMAAGTSNGITGPENAEFRAGMWWDPELDGSGWEINRGGDVVFGIWYTYDADGNPTWYTTSGSLDDGRFENELLSFSWNYEKNRVNEPEVVGSVTIDFLHPQLAEISWQLGEHKNRHTVRPFIFTANPTLADYSGSFYDPKESGYGVTIQTQGKLTYAVIYYYDDKGQPIWAAGTNARDSEKLEMLGFNGSCPWCEYALPDYAPTGEMVLAFPSESTMNLQMDFPQAVPFWTKDQSLHHMLSDLPSGRPHPSALATIASEEALAHYFEAGYLDGNGRPYYSMFCPPPIVSPAPPPAATPSEAAISATNVQEQGVDEADVIKATTDFIYSLDFPMGEVPYSDETSSLLQFITRYRISANGESPQGDGSFKVILPTLINSDRSIYLQNQGLYHYQADDPEFNKLIYLTSQVEGGCQQVSAAVTTVSAFDTGTGTDFLIDHQLQIEGELIASRTIGKHLFLAVTFRPDLFTLATETYGLEAAREMGFAPEDIELLFDSLKPGALLPTVTYADGTQQRFLRPENIMMPPLPLSNIDPVLSALIMLDLNDLKAAPESVAIMGRIDGMYASPRSVYFASTRNEYVFNDAGSLTRSGWIDTDIHKLSILENTLKYRGSGSIEGYLGGGAERLAFRMSEYQDQLRLVSSSSSWRERWGELGRHRLTILGDADEDKLLLNTISVLPNASRPENIGKPGENIHAVRYQGKRAYVVTFERVDPLYALDLSNPEDPKVLGGLEIEGFSDYLHPIGDDLLIGIGMAAVPSTNGFWLQGVQVGLFDVSMPTAPVLLDLEKIGYRGTTTSVLNTHRAFTSLPSDPDNSTPMRFIIPVTEHAPPDGILDPDPAYRYPWDSTGIRMFEVNEKAGGLSTLNLVGRANVASADTILEDSDHFYMYTNEDYSRSVIYGDQVFHYYRGGLFMTGWPGDVFTPAENCPLCVPGD